MQMSIERFKDIHKLIWDTVIAYSQDAIEVNLDIQFLKGVGINRARAKGMLDEDEEIVIRLNNNCMLCSTFEYCKLCPLKTCSGMDSLYFKAVQGNIKAMQEIRDIVDKKPFTELSIVELYSWEDF